MKKILVINPFGIGDVLFTTPIIHTLKEAYPDTHIGYLCNRRTAFILRDNPFIESVFIYDRDEFDALRRKSFFLWLRSFFNFMNRIKKEHFDLALDFSLNSLFGFFSWYAGIGLRAGYDFKKRGRFLNKKINLTGYNDRPMPEYYSDVLKLFGLDSKYKKLELYLNPGAVHKIEDFLAGQGIGPADILVGIAPGGGKSWGKDAYFKHWLPERFAQLADKIIENYKVRLIIVGDFSESDIASKVSSGMKNMALNLCGKTDLSELAALLSKMKLLIANDGGPLHMACALGIKTVSIFGPVDELVYGPYPFSDSHIVIKKDLPCRPCYRNFRFNGCNFNRKCINEISMEEAYLAVKRLM